MNQAMRSFFDYYGSIESWNTDRIMLPDGAHQKQGASSLTYLREIIQNEDIDESKIKDDVAYLNKQQLYFDSDTPIDLLNDIDTKTYSIPVKRVIKGFECGFIDAVTDSYAKTSKGWVNKDLNVVASVDADLEVVLNVIKKKANLIDSFSVKEISEMMSKDVLIVNNEAIAVKNNFGLWINERGKTFPEGEVLRVIAHSDQPVYTYTGLSDDTLYHGNLSDKIVPDESSRSRGMSLQGDAAYSTGSIKEAVYYANPYGFETSGKLLALEESDKIKNRKDFIFGHIYEVNPGFSSLYVADTSPRSGTMLDRPSLSSILLMCKLTGANEVYATKQWADLANAGSSYDAYAIMNHLNNYICRHDKAFDPLKKMISSLGFDGLKVNFPTVESLKSAERSIETIKKEFSCNSYREERMIGSFVKGLEKSLSILRESVPPRAENSHLILYNLDELSKKHLKLLPFNKGSFMDQDEIYKQETNLTIDDIMSFESPSSEDANSFIEERDNVNKKSMFSGLDM